MKQKNLVLMVVAVGCGLAAAFLTSRMSAKPAPVETVELLVAAKDLPVGTMLTKDGLPALVTTKQVARDAVPAKAVESADELADKRLGRPIRAGEPFTPADLTKGAVSIPTGMSMTTLPVNVAQAVAGFVGPGSRVDVLASVRLKSKVEALPILVNMLVLAVNADLAPPKEGAAFQTVSNVSFAVDRRQALLIKLALARNCDLSLLLRNPDERETDIDRGYDIEKVTKLLQDDDAKAEVHDGSGREPGKPAAPAPKPETVTVPVAAADIPAGTPVTADLLADPKAFARKELPKELAADAVADFAPYHGQTFRTGLGKGQWATAALIGPAEAKPGEKEAFTPPKEAARKDPPKPAPKPPARKTHDVAVHSPAGTKVYRYEEVTPGEWRLLGLAPAARPAAEPPPAADRRVD